MEPFVIRATMANGVAHGPHHGCFGSPGSGDV